MPVARPQKLSIAVVCFNTPAGQLRALCKSLAAAIDVLKRQIPGMSTDITLVDNSGEGVSPLHELVSNSELGGPDHYAVRFISGQGNIGFARAHNLVIKDLESDFHLILNPDVVLDSQAIARGVGYLLDNDNVVLLSPRATDERGNKQHLCKRYPSVFLFFLRGFVPKSLRPLFSGPLAHYEMHDLSEEAPTAGIPIASGCFMLCRSEALRAAGGFDPSYFLYFEDFDLSLRLSGLGDIVYLPAMEIVHHGGRSARKGWSHIRMFLQSGFRFFNAHGWRVV